MVRPRNLLKYAFGCNHKSMNNSLTGLETQIHLRDYHGIMIVIFGQFKILPVPRHLEHAYPSNIKAPMFTKTEYVIFISLVSGFSISTQQFQVLNPQCVGRTICASSAKFHAP